MIAASLSLADIPAVARLWKQRKTEAWLSFTAFLAVTLLGVLPGIGIAVVTLDLERVPPDLVAAPGRPGRHAGPPWLPRRGEPSGGDHDPGLVLFRFDAPLIFANARTFSEQVHKLAGEPGVRWIVIAAEPITDVDTTAADMLEELDEWLNSRGISLAIAEMKDPVRHKITRYELTRTIDPSHFYPTIQAAVTAYDALDAGSGDATS